MAFVGSDTDLITPEQRAEIYRKLKNVVEDQRDDAMRALCATQAVAREAWQYIRQLHNEVGPRFPGAEVCDKLASVLGPPTCPACGENTYHDDGKCAGKPPVS